MYGRIGRYLTATIMVLMLLTSAVEARPYKWCGWWMQQRTGIHSDNLNLARNWAQVGRGISHPVPGAVGVMHHHVFIVEEVLGNGKVLATSGNDGHAVRTRVRSTSGVFAWRLV